MSSELTYELKNLRKENEKLKEENENIREDIVKIREDVEKLYELLETHLNVSKDTCPGCKCDSLDWKTCDNCNTKVCESCIVDGPRGRNGSPSCDDGCKVCV